MTERPTPQPPAAGPVSRRRLSAHAAGWAAWGCLSIAATVLQNAPDLLDWLPNEAIWGLVVIGALAQLPFIVRDVRRTSAGRGAQPFWREGRGDNLLHPEPHFTGYGEQRRRLRRLFRGFPRPGRRGLAARLRPWLLPGRHTPPLVVVVTGAPGTGKSQLANRIARDVQDRFPDGSRWVDLTTGTSPDEEEGEEPPGGAAARMRLRDVLPRRLRRLPGRSGPDEGDPAAERAAEFAAAAASSRPRTVPDLLEELLGASGDSPRGPRRHLEEAWRSRTAGRRLLLVLENAQDPAQVAALLPNSPYSAVVVTSRRPFHDVGFSYVEEHLEGLTQDEGAELLDRQVPLPSDAREREHERALRRTIASHCHGLPLALKMCGTRLASHSGEDTEELLDKLRSTDGTPLLGPTGFPASFLGVFRLCGTEAARLLHRMAATGMREVADYGAAALLDADRARAAEVLAELVGLSLIEPIGRADDGVHRYRMHQLVHDTMRTLGPAELGVDPEEARREWSPEAAREAGRRLVAAYTWMVERAAADQHRVDAGFPRPPIAGADPGPGDDGGLGLAGPEHPPAWLDRERGAGRRRRPRPARLAAGARLRGDVPGPARPLGGVGPGGRGPARAGLRARRPARPGHGPAGRLGAVRRARAVQARRRLRRARALRLRAEGCGRALAGPRPPRARGLPPALGRAGRRQGGAGARRGGDGPARGALVARADAVQPRRAQRRHRQPGPRLGPAAVGVRPLRRGGRHRPERPGPGHALRGPRR
ncbi:NB-ARC domain-containing protein [Nocardiopsis halophila]|uniref:NB-ARC domain-containing protein n=1 Tax=Nocardiopsis halophila TaxID=141692 RepID=UPI000475A7D6|nr:NB-ARC domain-containing protein [Nocardiopsis halophila]